MTFLKQLQILGGLALICGCSHSPNKTTDKVVWSSDAIWVQPTLKNDNNFFRKINRMQPVFYKDLIIVGNSIDGLVAYNLETRREAWRIAISFGVEASAALINDRLFVGGNDGQLYAIDLKSQQIIWTFSTNSEVVSEPLLYEGVLYFLTSSQSLYAVDAVTGKQIWIFNRQDTRHLMTIRGGSKPTISNGILFTGFSDGSVVALNAKTGTPQWEILLNKNSRFSDIDSSPVIDGDKLYINSYDDKIYCLSKQNGEILWRAPYGGPNTPLVVGDQIIVSSSTGDLVSLNKKDGQVNWKKTTSNGIFSEVTLFKGLILAGESQGSLKAFDLLTGELQTSFEPGRGVFSKPAISISLSSAFFISGEGHLYQIKIEPVKKSHLPFLR